MNSTRLTLALLAAIAIAVAVVPEIRSAAVLMFEANGDAEDIPFDRIEQVAETGDDPRLWLAAAEVGRQRLDEWANMSPDAPLPPEYAPDRDELAEVYDRGVEAAPHDPAIRLSRIEFMAYPVGNLLKHEPPATPDADQRAVLKQLRHELRKITELDPANGMPRMLIAWTWLAQGDANRAANAVLEAREAEHLESYQSEVAAAVMDLKRRLDVPPYSHLWNEFYRSQKLPPWQAKLDDLAGAFEEAANASRLSDRHEVAVRFYAALIHLARLRQAEPWDFEDITRSGDYLVTEALTREQTAGYLREHGREDLAALYQRELERADFLNMRVDRVPVEPPRAHWSFEWEDVPLLLLNPLTVTFWLMLVVAALVVIASVLTQFWRESRWRVGWGGFLLMSALLIVPPALVIVLLEGATPRLQDDAIIVPAALMPLGGVILWVIVAWHLGRRKARSLPEADRPGAGRMWLGYMRKLIGPTLALLVLAMLPSLHYVFRQNEEAVAQRRQVAFQGEVQYHALTASEEQFVKRTHEIYGERPLHEWEAEQDSRW